MPNPPKAPIEKIPAKDIKYKWTDFFEVTIAGSSSELPAVKNQINAAMNYIQSHVFTDAHYKGDVPASLDGQGLMYEMAEYYAIIR